MSFGFGFALPAYPLRGGGGNNPFNQTGPTLDLSFVDGATNVGNQLGADTYTLDTNFITPQYQVAAQYAVWVDGSGMTQRNFADIVTFTRGSAATQFDSTGTLIFAPMNAIRNNMMVGAVAGTPGTLPTNWQSFVSGTAAVAVVGTGVESGITYVDITFSGGNTDSISFFIDGTLGHPALNGQTWTGSAYYRLMAGSFANCTALQAIYEATGAGAALANSNITITTVTGAALSTQRISITRTNNNASTAQEQLTLQITGTGAFNFTLRIGMPQLELGSTATAVNATSGTAYYGPRFDYNPSTLAAQGLLIEEQRTNSIRNNTMQGAVAGTPGTLPTNWGTFTTLTGITTSVVGTGTENGITYIDFRLNGTPSASGGFDIYPETSNGVSALTGQTWSQAQYVRLAAGTTAGVTSVTPFLAENTSAGVFVRSNSGTPFTPASTALNVNRVTQTATLSGGATVGAIRPGLFISLTGAAIDITLRIGLPQLEQGAFATSVIPTTTTALTRSQDRAVVSTLSPWFNSVAGTIYAEFAVTQPVSGANQFLARFSDNGYNNSIADNIDSGGFAALVTASGGVFDGNASTSPAVSANTVNKFAGAYAANDLAASRNGGTVATDNTATIPSGLTRFDLGSDHAGFNNIKAGYLRRIVYYPRRLPNADLQTITA